MKPATIPGHPIASFGGFRASCSVWTLKAAILVISAPLPDHSEPTDTRSLVVAGMEFDSVVYFAAHEAYNRNVLGRRGWLNKVRLGLIDYEGKLYFSHADEASPEPN